MRAQSILIVVHQQHSTPGLLGELLQARGYQLDRRCPCLGDPLPKLDDYVAAIVFGGPQSASENSPGINAELKWIENIGLPSNKPLLGICLGAQEIARVLGAQTGPRADGVVEIGYWPVSPTAYAGEFLTEVTTFYQWHSDTFEIPKDAVHLAFNEHFPSQAFRYGNQVYAIEFHPEMTLEMIRTWCQSERGAPKLKLPGAQSPAAQFAGYQRHHHASQRWLENFLDTQLLAGTAMST